MTGNSRPAARPQLSWRRARSSSCCWSFRVIPQPARRPRPRLEGPPSRWNAHVWPVSGRAS